MGKFTAIDSRKLGETLKKNRRQHRLTQQTVANILGVDRSTYAKYELGRKPDVDVLMRLAAVYGSTLDELLADFIKDELANPASVSAVNAPETAGENLTPLSDDEIKLIRLFRSSVRKTAAVEKAVDALGSEK